MTSAPTDRQLVFVAFASLLAVAIALVSQHFYDMPPCAYCVFQRVVYLAIAASAVVALLLRRVRPAQMVFTLLAFVFSLIGMWAAWYQHTVAQHMLSCDRTFADRFMTQSGLEAALPNLFGIFASCMDAAVDVFGVKYEIWSLALFAVLGVVSLMALIRQARTPARLFA
jgi:disulfide bond formation protein DsbB